MYPLLPDNNDKKWKSSDQVWASLSRLAGFFDLSPVFDSLAGLFTVPKTEKHETIIRRFDLGQPLIEASRVVLSEDMWLLRPDEVQLTRFFKASCPDLRDCEVVFRLKMRTYGLTGWAFPEMVCEFVEEPPEKVRDMEHVLRQTTAWTAYELPFRVFSRNAPAFYRLNVLASGQGSVFIKDVELVKRNLVY